VAANAQFLVDSEGFVQTAKSAQVPAPATAPTLPKTDYRDE
jgi:Cu(I)/Ag(I) efflux system membrane fusion protein